MALPAFQVPYRYITGLPPQAQEEIRRDFEEVARKFESIPSTGFDAIVVSGATDNNSTRTYATVFSAIRALDALGFVNAHIGVVARGGTITETAALGARTNLTTVWVTGIDAGQATVQLTGPDTKWNLAGFSTTGTGLKNWRLDRMHVLTGSGKTFFFEGTGTSLFAYRTNFDGSGSATSTTQPGLLNGGGGYLYQCETLDCDLSASIAFSCFLTWNTCKTYTFALGWEHVGCRYAGLGSGNFSFTFTGTNSFIQIGSTVASSNPDNGAGAAFMTFTTTTARHVLVTSLGQRTNAAEKAIWAISGHISAYIDVMANALTLGAGNAANTGCTVRGVIESTADLTGPALVHLACERTILRGKGLTGDINILFSTSGGTAITGTALTDSALVITARRTVAASTQKGYALDASTTRNVIVFSGKTDFPTASTDAGSTNLVITEDGVPVALHASTHLPGGTDPLTTAAAGTIQPDDAAAVGTANSFARSDHKHAIVADIAVAVGAALAEGVSTSFSRADHVHTLPDVLTAGGPTGSATVVPVITWDVKGRLTVVTSASIALTATGDATGTLPGALTLSTTGVTANPYGGAKKRVAFTVDAKGRLTAASETTVEYVADIGDGATNPIAVTHSLGTKTIDVTIRRKSDDTIVVPDSIVATSTTVVTVGFDVIPTSAQYEIYVKAAI